MPESQSFVRAEADGRARGGIRQLLSESAVTLIAFMVSQPVCGWLSDRLGRKPLLLTAFGGATLVTWPVMNEVAHAASAWTAVCLIVAAVTLQSCYTSISAVVKAELFPAAIRTLAAISFVAVLTMKDTQIHSRIVED